jgi:hypothetical protein
MKSAYTVLVRNSEGNSPLGKPRHRWVDNVKMDPNNAWFENMEWTYLDQDRDQWQAFLNLQVPLRWGISQEVTCFVK